MFKQYIEHQSTSEEIQYVEEVWSEKWQEKAFDDDLAYLRTGEYIKILNRYIKPKSRILEGGCGQGQWVRLFNELGHNITGVDLSRSTVEEFKKKYPKFDVRQGDVFKLDFPANTFDVYLSYGVIEHFEAGPDPVIAEANRVLKPDGLFCVSVPFLNKEKRKRLHGITDNKADFSNSQSLRFYQYVMEKNELRNALEKNGFEIIKIYPTDTGHTLKTKSHMASGIASATKTSGGIVKILRPFLRKAWHFYVGLQSKEKHAHMIFAICRAKKH